MECVVVDMKEVVGRLSSAVVVLFVSVLVEVSVVYMIGGVHGCAVNLKV